MRRYVALTLMLALGLTACGHPLVPFSALRRTAPPAARLTVKPPVLGVDLYAASGYPLAVVRQDGLRNLAYMRRVLGAQSAGIVWSLHSPSPTSAVVRRTSISLSPAAVELLTKLAQADHMSVQYRPLIRVQVGARWHWEGRLRPRDKHAWFASLFRAELPYMRIAQRLHVAEFVVGTELVRLHAKRQWPWFLAKVHSVYHGVVSYAAQMKQYFGRPQNLPPVSEYGVDPYPYLHLRDTASVRQLEAGWNRYFDLVPEAILERTTMDEVSIPAIAGAYREPPIWSIQGRPDPTVQVRWFTTACTIAQEHHMLGIYFYEVNLLDNPAHPLSFSAFFEGQPGAHAIHRCLKIFNER